MGYVEHSAPAGLRPWVSCLWERTAEGDESVRVLPDGCIDVVWSDQSGARLVGPNRVAFLTDVPTGARIVGARLTPGGAPALLGVAAEEVCDVQAPLEELCGADGARLGADLQEAGDALTTALAEWLGARRSGARSPDPIVVAVASRLQGAPADIRSLAAELSVSERSLRRRVRAGVGYGPKRLARVFRLQRALRLAAGTDGKDLAGLAFEAGYADQPHFTRECAELAGVTPAALIAA